MTMTKREAVTMSQNEPPRSQRPVEDNAGWTIFSYLLSGMVAYGLIGWLVAHFTHLAVLTPIGALAGLLLAVVVIVFRYGRHRP
jgi:ATP synthase protein I